MGSYNVHTEVTTGGHRKKLTSVGLGSMLLSLRQRGLLILLLTSCATGTTVGPTPWLAKIVKELEGRVPEPLKIALHGCAMAACSVQVHEWALWNVARIHHKAAAAATDPHERRHHGEHARWFYHFAQLHPVSRVPQWPLVPEN